VQERSIWKRFGGKRAASLRASASSRNRGNHGNIPMGAKDGPRAHPAGGGRGGGRVARLALERPRSVGVCVSGPAPRNPPRARPAILWGGVPWLSPTGIFPPSGLAQRGRTGFRLRRSPAPGFARPLSGECCRLL